MRSISILGSTGSIGRSTLSVVESYPDRFQIIALAAGKNLDTVLEQAVRWKPRVVSVASESDAEALRSRLKAAGLGTVEVLAGSAGTVRVATHPEADFVVSAIVGVAGLEATYEAVRAGKTVGLANKECLVAAGELITAEARRQGKPLLPIDSEHNALAGVLVENGDICHLRGRVRNRQRDAIVLVVVVDPHIELRIAQAGDAAIESPEEPIRTVDRQIAVRHADGTEEPCIA